MTPEQVRASAVQTSEAVGLTSSPVGVRLLTDADGSAPSGAEPLVRHRYCQALMLARRGKNVWLDGANLACPATAAAFGFRPLPAGLESGQGLVGFGIVADPIVGQRMFAAMPRLESQSLKGLHLCSLEDAETVPDIVVVEDEVEALMWIALAYLHATGGERVQSSTAVLQATCVDCAIVPYLEQRLNFTCGCYGCRDASDLGRNDAASGFPVRWLPDIVTHLTYLSDKAMPAARSKRAWVVLSRDARM